MAPFALKRPGSIHGRASQIRVVVLARNVTALLIKLRGRFRMRVAGCRAAAGGHRGVCNAIGVARLACAAIPLLVGGLVKGHRPRNIFTGNGLGMAPFTIEWSAGVGVVVLARRGGSPLIMGLSGV